MQRQSMFLPRLHHGVLAVLLAGSIFGYPFYNVVIAGLPITLDRVLLGALVAWALLRLILGRESLPGLQRADVWLLCFIGIVAFNVGTSDWRFRQFQPVSQLIFNYLMPLGLYAVVRLVGHRRQAWTVLRFGLMGLGTYLAFTAICEYREWSSLVFPRFIMSLDDPEFLGRGRGPFLNPIACGLFQIVGLCCGLTLWGKAEWPGNAGLIAFAVLMGGGLYATMTRSVWLAAGLVLALYLWHHSSWRWRGIYLMAAPALLLGGLVTVGDKWNALKRDKDVSLEDMSESVELRPLLAIVARNMIQDRPIMGHGLRQYPQAANVYHFRNVRDVPLQRVIAFVQHNLFLAYAVELGLLGLSSYLVMVATFGWLSLKLWWTPNLPGEVQQAGFVVFATLFSFLLNGFFHDVAIIHMLHFLLFTLLGVAAALHGHFFPHTILGQASPPQKKEALDQP